MSFLAAFLIALLRVKTVNFSELATGFSGSNAGADYPGAPGVENTIKLWNRDGTLLKTLGGHTAQIWSIGFSPDGQMIVSGSQDRTIRFWNRDGTLLKTLNNDNSVRSVSPDGQTFVSSSDDETIKLWNRDGTLLKTLKGHTSIVTSVRFSPDGQMIASVGGGYDKTVKL